LQSVAADLPNSLQRSSLCLGPISRCGSADSAPTRETTAPRSVLMSPLRTGTDRAPCPSSSAQPLNPDRSPRPSNPNDPRNSWLATPRDDQGIRISPFHRRWSLRSPKTKRTSPPGQSWPRARVEATQTRAIDSCRHTPAGSIGNRQDRRLLRTMIRPQEWL
jgi:hypothetical protein